MIFSRISTSPTPKKLTSCTTTDADERWQNGLNNSNGLGIHGSNMDIKVFVLITLVITIYIVLGGLLFQHLEQSKEQYDGLQANNSSPNAKADHKLDEKRCLGKNDLDELLQNLLGQLLTDGWTLNVTIRDGKNQTRDDGSEDLFLHVEVTLPTPKDRWDLYGSIFYAETLVTTIGYGQIAPLTIIGRMVSCFYAIVGIPIFGLWVAAVGEMITETATKLRKRIKMKKRWHLRFLVVQVCIITLIGAVIFIFSPAILFSYMEDWDYSDSIYFTVITLATIGLGDFVAGSRDEAPGWYRVFLNFWLFFGLGWLTMIIALGISIYRTRATQVMKKAEVKVVQMTKEIKQKLYANRLLMPRRNSFSGKRQVSVMLSKTATGIQVMDLSTGLTRLISHKEEAGSLLELASRETPGDLGESGGEVKPVRQTSYTRRPSNVVLVSDEPGKTRRRGSLVSLQSDHAAPKPGLPTILETSETPKQMKPPPRLARFASWTIGNDLIVQTSKKRPSFSLRSASVLLFDQNRRVSDSVEVNNSVLEQLARETSPMTPSSHGEFVVPSEGESSSESEVLIMGSPRLAPKPTTPQRPISGGFWPPSFVPQFSTQQSVIRGEVKRGTLILETPPTPTSPQRPVSLLRQQLSTQQSAMRGEFKRGTSILDSSGNIVHNLNDTNNLVVMTDNGIAECLDSEITVLRPRSKSVDGL